MTERSFQVSRLVDTCGYRPLDLPFDLLSGLVDEAARPAHGVTRLTGGHDHHAVVRSVFEVEEPEQGAGQFTSVRCCAPQQVSCATVIFAAVAAAEPGTADGVGGGNAGEHGEASSHIEILVTVTLVQH
jgi:hypothetical protein